MTLKLSASELEQANRLVKKIQECQYALDENFCDASSVTVTNYEAGSSCVSGVSYRIPITGEIMRAAARAEITKCHEMLEMLGIAFIPEAQRLSKLEELKRHHGMTKGPTVRHSFGDYVKAGIDGKEGPKGPDGISGCGMK